ncbi:MAG: homocysteine S-methyltransferase family protein [Clostridiaceae bacterium]|nr:homocysteine S-methyltransferase family protein [Clostridiaceae bacterium]
MDFFERFKVERLYFDGAMGTMLHAAGLPVGVPPELWNVTHPDTVSAIHRAYAAAGAKIAKANTFGAYAHKLGGVTVEDVVHAAVKNARDAGADYVALDVGPTGKLIEPLGDTSFEEAAADFACLVTAGANADCILIETMTNLAECRAAVIAAKENTNLPVLASLTFDENGRMLSGADPETAIAVLEAAGADAIGVNCGLGPKLYTEILRRMELAAHVPLFANPNAGIPEVVEGKTVFPLDPKEFAREMRELAPYTFALGGCCGTNPAHIANLVVETRDIAMPVLRKRTTAVVASASQTLTLGDRPVMIGERLNPTGKPKLKSALRAGDMGYLQREALSQADRGADALDVNVGLPGIDETATLVSATRALMGVCALPLQLDTVSPTAMAAALRVYCGRALINSVSGKQSVMDAVFPIAKKYDGVLIALTLDDDGIPKTAEGRLAIAEKIKNEAGKYGIAPCDLIFDPLAMAVSADADAAGVALDTIRLIRERLNGVCSLGVSNISFGLPQRENMNAAFLTLALGAGLKAAIVNPGSDAMRSAFDSYLVLAGYDEKCLHYIERYSEDSAAVEKPKSAAEPKLRDAVVRGLKSAAAAAAGKLLDAGVETMAIVDGELIPALDEVGRGFEKGKLFLPQLMLSADAAKAAFTVLRERMQAAGETSESRGVIVLATVEGDIHDIGKNIAGSILENYGYTVRDLGRNVPVDDVVEAVVCENVKLCGLSALMTTTVDAMARTIQALHERAPWCRIMVGGAVLTEDYAKSIGADYYCPNAMTDVRIAEEIFGQ